MIGRLQALKQARVLHNKLNLLLDNSRQVYKDNDEMLSEIEKLRELVNKTFEELEDDTYAVYGKLSQVYNQLVNIREGVKPELGHIFIAQLRHKMLNQDGNIKVLVVGGNGKGKSYSSIELGLAVDPSFTIRRNVIFSPEDFIDVVSHPSYKGSAYVWDEIGVGFAAREFASRQNRGISQVLQTFRIQNSMFILTVPSAKMVDTHARELSDIILQAVKVYRGSKENVLRIYYIKEDFFSGKIYRKKPVMAVNGTDYVFSNIRLRKMPAPIEREYKRKKERFFYDYLLVKVKKLIQEAEEKSVSKLELEQERIRNLKLVLPYILEHPEKYGIVSQRTGYWRIDHTLIMRDMNVSEKDAKVLRKWAQKELNGGL